MLGIICTLLVGLLALAAMYLMVEYMEYTMLLIVAMIFGLIFRAIFEF